MSGIKHANLTQVYRLLRARGQTTRTLAAALGYRRHAYVSRMLTGHERHGPAWRRLCALLTEGERALLEAMPPRERQRTVLRELSAMRATA